MQNVWIEAAREAFDEVGEPADEQATARLAALIEEMASMDPEIRREYPDEFIGAEAEAMRAWVRDTDESDGY